MNEVDFKEKWDLEKPIYKAWGDFVLENIENGIRDSGESLDVFFKIPPSVRLKSNESLVDKAFYRPGKNYSDPYNDIEDKVGVRFVVLLLENIDKICKYIEGSANWSFDKCKHFNLDREREPLLFTYQSVHYILRPVDTFNYGGVEVLPNTPCEVQVRTLLQHAHAELTHDAIYKSKKAVLPAVHRTVAKSMALIETTDDFFTDVTKKLNEGPVEQFSVQRSLDEIYMSLTQIEPLNQKSSLAIFDCFEKFVTEDLPNDIEDFMSENSFLVDSIKSNFDSGGLYRQSVVLFVYYLLRKRKQRLMADWPFSMEKLEPLANDLGVSLYS
ncbi:GTP pyrophosphokinase [Gilvimarinus algae]|uniref:RelA/SpoT domain-containing protein n=1 Tax=Gilvimarinus algae TaxID=3058037 RepID=A0ABT8TJT9_9GAMM|nr:hypothetical protein [Gilvimarinus sp. SDUM040014]MDO3383845.1 hypothetical protein [Gilvimarinus sp. SDUM040014]